MDNKKSVIWWIRRDIRLHDNQALSAALATDLPVVPIYILDDNLLKQSNLKRLNFLFENLHSLDTFLQEKGNHLIIRSGNPFNCLKNLFRESNADAIFTEADFSPYAKDRDEKIASAVPLHLLPGMSIRAPSEVYKQDGKPYTVFTPYSHQWHSSIPSFPPLKIPDQIPALFDLTSEPIPASIPHPLFPAGERIAVERLQDFLNKHIQTYSMNRDLVGVEGTSNLSPYFHFGVLSARSAYYLAELQKQNQVSIQAVNSIEAWINELVWRDFYIMILSEFPHVLKEAFRESYNRIAWRNAEVDFRAWKAGETGYPLVDAGMRQLQETGWMHNRARMIAASFLCKDLLINWQWGESWFNEQLIDGDLAANNGGWQWCAGCGTDATPYFRVFNPIIQSRKFDPTGVYIRTWIPELRNVPTQFIHTPWEMPLELQTKVRCEVGKNYPNRIIEHAFARQRALDAYRRIRV